MSDAAPPLALRPVDPDDDALLEAWFANMAQVFRAPWIPSRERRELRREGLRAHRLTGAFDGDRLVATYRSWDWALTVPGGTVTADAVSTVTVLPTHRRRGALTGLITADLARARAAGAPVAVLIASEAPIYGRYGFGPATRSTTWEVDVHAARLRPEVPREGSLEIMDPAHLRPIAPAIFEAARGPGATDRDPGWWDTACGIVRPPEEPASPRVAVVHTDADGVPQGFLVHGWRDDWDDHRVGHTVVTVEDFHVATPAAYAALWRYLVELDLVATVRAPYRPVDEPLPWLLADPRAARRVATTDFLWLRLLDPVAALTARRYEVPGDVVLQITDPLGHAAGTFALVVGGDGAAVARPTTAAPEVTLPVDVLSAAWLGDGGLPAAAVAGRAVEHRAGALARAERLFSTAHAPWTGTWF